MRLVFPDFASESTACLEDFFSLLLGDFLLPGVLVLECFGMVVSSEMIVGRMVVDGSNFT